MSRKGPVLACFTGFLVSDLSLFQRVLHSPFSMLFPCLWLWDMYDNNEKGREGDRVSQRNMMPKTGPVDPERLYNGQQGSSYFCLIKRPHTRAHFKLFFYLFNTSRRDSGEVRLNGQPKKTLSATWKLPETFTFFFEQVSQNIWTMYLRHECQKYDLMWI